MDLKFLIKQNLKSILQLKRQVARDRSDRREMDMVAGLVDEKPLVIFSKSSCCMSHSTKSFLRGFGANPTVYELDQMPNGQQIERALLQRGCRPSVPAVFIGQELVGGTNTVMSLHVQNRLVPLLMRAKAIWIWNDR